MDQRRKIYPTKMSDYSSDDETEYNTQIDYSSQINQGTNENTATTSQYQSETTATRTGQTTNLFGDDGIATSELIDEITDQDLINIEQAFSDSNVYQANYDFLTQHAKDVEEKERQEKERDS